MVNQLYLYLSPTNINSVMAIEHYKPQSIVILRDSNLHTPEDSYTFLDYLRKEGYTVNSTGINFEHAGSIDQLRKQITSDDLILLPTVQTNHGYQLFALGLDKDILMAQVETDGDLYEFKDGAFRFVTDRTNVDIEDFITSRGGKIESSSKAPFELEITNHLLIFIEENLEAYKHCFRYRFSRFVTVSDSSRVTLNTTQIDSRHHNFITELLDFLVHHHCASFQRKGPKVIVYFNNTMIKNYLFKTGTWLEHLLYNLIKDIGVDDLDSSLTFLWDTNIRKLKNEVDLIAISNNQLYVASCKDTQHIDPDQLNEIYANTTHLGYKSSHAMLFTTCHVSEGIEVKADEFGITLVNYNKNHQKIIRQLRACFL